MRTTTPSGIELFRQDPSFEAQPIMEALVRSFYPAPYTASPSLVLTTPWYLDYGHLTFWFLVGSTVVLVL
jgi:hypothetical protein